MMCQNNSFFFSIFIIPLYTIQKKKCCMYVKITLTCKVPASTMAHLQNITCKHENSKLWDILHVLVREAKWQQSFFRDHFPKECHLQKSCHLLVVTFIFLGSPEYFSLTQISLLNCLSLGRKFVTHQKKKKNLVSRKLLSRG